MSPYAVRLRGAARKEYDKLAGDTQRRVLDALISLEQEPVPHGARVLVGELQGLHRIRVGAYRIVYQVDEQEQMVNVVRIRPRSQAYK